MATVTPPVYATVFGFHYTLSNDSGNEIFQAMPFMKLFTCAKFSNKSKPFSSFTRLRVSVKFVKAHSFSYECKILQNYINHDTFREYINLFIHLTLELFHCTKVILLKKTQLFLSTKIVHAF